MVLPTCQRLAPNHRHDQGRANQQPSGQRSRHRHPAAMSSRRRPATRRAKSKNSSSETEHTKHPPHPGRKHWPHQYSIHSKDRKLSATWHLAGNSQTSMQSPSQSRDTSNAITVVHVHPLISYDGKQLYLWFLSRQPVKTHIAASEPPALLCCAAAAKARRAPLRRVLDAVLNDTVRRCRPALNRIGFGPSTIESRCPFNALHPLAGRHSVAVGGNPGHSRYKPRRETRQQDTQGDQAKRCQSRPRNHNAVGLGVKALCESRFSLRRRMLTGTAHARPR